MGAPYSRARFDGVTVDGPAESVLVTGPAKKNGRIGDSHK